MDVAVRTASADTVKRKNLTNNVKTNSSNYHELTLNKI